MPTYEDVCRCCGHRFEVVRSIHDDALTECPDCGGELRKVFAPPAISFKGSGFYATDHGKRAKSSTSSDPSKKDSSPTSKDGASSGGSESSSKEPGSKESGSQESG